MAGCGHRAPLPRTYRRREPSNTPLWRRDRCEACPAVFPALRRWNYKNRKLKRSRLCLDNNYTATRHNLRISL